MFIVPTTQTLWRRLSDKWQLPGLNAAGSAGTSVSTLGVTTLGVTTLGVIALGTILSAMLPTAVAGEPVAFDRPGIGFGTQVLSAGQFSWEQGLPDFSRDRADDGLALSYSANTLWRFGLGKQLELQLASNIWNQQRGNLRASGAGDSSVALKMALPAVMTDIDWALRASYQHPTGQAPFRADHNSQALAVSLSHAQSHGRSFSLFVEYGQSKQAHSWTVSPSYTFYADEQLSAYTELGWSDDPQSGSSAGAGGVWRLNPHWQLDLWFLRGLSSGATDWQTGLGLSFTPD